MLTKDQYFVYSREEYHTHMIGRVNVVLDIPTLVVCNMCLILTVSYYILLRMAEPQLGWGVARDGGSRGVRSN